jgi:hypothetical protein
VERFFDDIGRAYDHNIQAPGKEVHFLILVAFLASFGFIRTSAHLIKAQVSWWPGNVETKGGTHVHHLVWGILLLLSMGYLGIAVDPYSPWLQLIAIGFGIGMGLALDEFALWLNLEDVYWSQKGRQSIDAVVVTVALLVIALLGLQFWVDVYQAVLILLGVSRDSHPVALIFWQVLGLAMTVVCFLKGKIFAGIVGLFIPLVAWIAAFRKAKPGSRWERMRRAHSTA